MAPSPENDNAPKAPDKSDKASKDSRNTATENKQVACVAKLNDGELKALLDEAINYKNPKDRLGKSDIFNNLLLEAEEEERNIRAERAVGSKLVRYCNPSAKKRHHSRHKREPSSVSENQTHGGSLNNLAKEELYETTGQLQRPRKTVSARQREGGSLPCNVNVPAANYDKQFFEEVRRKQKARDYEEETVSLLEHDSLMHREDEDAVEMAPTQIPRIPTKYTTSAKLQVESVDDSVVLPALEDKLGEASQSVDQFETNIYPTSYNVCPRYNTVDEKVRPSSDSLRKRLSMYQTPSLQLPKMDENGNAVPTNGTLTMDAKKSKKKKTQTEKNVVVKSARDVPGHRTDIIDDVDKLNEYICGATLKSNVHKSKLHKHMQGEDKAAKKQRTRSKGKSSNASELKKSNSLDEMSSSVKLDDLVPMQQDQDVKLPLRPTKSNSERLRERRSWGNSEQLQLYPNMSVENLETAEFHVVTKKKKSKKRRNSLSSRQTQATEDSGRCRSPELRRKLASSVPHSEKSNDSSDVDSVHSLPVDAGNRRQQDLEDGAGGLPISYADIAKNNGLEKPKWSRQSVEKKTEVEKIKTEIEEVQNEKQPTKPKPQAVTQGVQTSPKLQQQPVHVEKSPPPIIQPKNSPPDVHNIHNFPTIQTALGDNNRTLSVCNKQSANNAVPKVYKNRQNNFIKNLKNSSVCAEMNAIAATVRRTIGNFAPQSDNQPMPSNIPDVQTIEKIHFAQANSERTDCDTDGQPAVVIMSGEATKEVSGLVFGFDINEKLLSDDVFDSFMARFLVPVKYNTSMYNHDKIVNFIGQAWEDVVNQSNGKVQYYTESM